MSLSRPDADTETTMELSDDHFPVRSEDLFASTLPETFVSGLLDTDPAETRGTELSVLSFQGLCFTSRSSPSPSSLPPHFLSLSTGNLCFRWRQWGLNLLDETCNHAPTSEAFLQRSMFPLRWGFPRRVFLWYLLDPCSRVSPRLGARASSSSSGEIY